MEGKERPKNEAEHSRLVGGSFKSQGNLLMMLVLGGHKTGTSPRLPARILKVYTESFIASNHVYHPDGLHNTLPLQTVSLETAPTVGMVGWTYIPSTGDGGRHPHCPSPACRATGDYVLWVTSTNPPPLVTYSCSFPTMWPEQSARGSTHMERAYLVVKLVGGPIANSRNL